MKAQHFWMQSCGFPLNKAVTIVTWEDFNLREGKTGPDVKPRRLVLAHEPQTNRVVQRDYDPKDPKQKWIISQSSYGDKKRFCIGMLLCVCICLCVIV